MYSEKSESIRTSAIFPRPTDNSFTSINNYGCSLCSFCCWICQTKIWWWWQSKQATTKKILFHSFFPSLRTPDCTMCSCCICWCWACKQLNKEKKTCSFSRWWVFYPVAIAISRFNSQFWLLLQQQRCHLTSSHALSMPIFNTRAHTMYERETRQGKEKNNYMVKVTQTQCTMKSDGKNQITLAILI